jgi:hypothetical protein
MSGNHVLETHDGLHRFFEPLEARRAGVGFVAAHHRRPLLRRHRPRAGIRQQVDQDVVRGDEEEIVARCFQQLFAMRARGLPDGFDALDSKRLDDCLYWHGDLELDRVKRSECRLLSFG